MKQPHKHAELIKAWADGAEIECFSTRQNLWCSVDFPAWVTDTEYRIKPEPKSDVVWYGCVFDDGSMDNLSQYRLPHDNLKLPFCGETGKLKNAEVLNQ